MWRPLLLACLLACLLAPSPARAVPIVPSVLDAEVAPHDGARDLPTNARLFLRFSRPATVTLEAPSRTETYVVDDFAARGQPLGALDADALHTVRLDDGADVRRLLLRTADAEDVTPPVLGRVLSAGSNRESASSFTVSVVVEPAGDDFGVAAHIVVHTDEEGIADAAALLDASASGVRWWAALQDAPPDDAPITLQAFVDVGEDDELLHVAVVAVDFAGNVSEASQPVPVPLERTHEAPPFGCSASGGSARAGGSPSGGSPSGGSPSGGSPFGGSPPGGPLTLLLGLFLVGRGAGAARRRKRAAL